MIQVIAPNGPERFQQGETVNVQWRSDGLLAESPSCSSTWAADWWTTGTPTASGRGGVAFVFVYQSGGHEPGDEPAPQAVYQTLSYPDYTGIGQKVAYQIPVPDGSYTIRLHFVEPG